MKRSCSTLKSAALCVFHRTTRQDRIAAMEVNAESNNEARPSRLQSKTVWLLQLLPWGLTFPFLISIPALQMAELVCVIATMQVLGDHRKVLDTILAIRQAAAAKGPTVQGSKGPRVWAFAFQPIAGSSRKSHGSIKGFSQWGWKLGKKAALQNVSLLPSKALAAAANQIPAEACAWLER